MRKNNQANKMVLLESLVSYHADEGHLKKLEFQRVILAPSCRILEHPPVLWERHMLVCVVREAGSRP